MVRGGIHTVGKGRDWACTLYREGGGGAGIEIKGDTGGGGGHVHRKLW